MTEDNFRERMNMEISEKLSPYLKKYEDATEHINQEILRNHKLYELMLPHRQRILLKIADQQMLVHYVSPRPLIFNGDAY